MGWQKGRDFYGVIRNFFMKQLPYRYLMHYSIKQLNATRAILEDGLEAYGDTEGTIIRRGDQFLMKGNAVFIPWDPQKEDKIYCYNTQQETNTWLLPASWNGIKEVYLYRLGSQGRELVKTLVPNEGKIKLDLRPNTGYVLYKNAVGNSPEIEWSTGSLIKDTGFDSQSFNHWKPQGKEENISIKTTDYGQDILSISGLSEGSVSQEIEGLVPGKEYTASVWVNVTGKKRSNSQHTGRRQITTENLHHRKQSDELYRQHRSVQNNLATHEECIPDARMEKIGSYSHWQQEFPRTTPLLSLSTMYAL